MSLARLQADFLDMILGEDASGLTVGQYAYHHAYRSRLADALGDTFEQTWAYLGDEVFSAAAQAFIAGHRSASWTLDAYGGEFPAFLAVFCPHNPEVAELAWLDAALRRAFVGADARGLEPGRLVDADWEKARLVLVPTFELGVMATNAAAIWRALSVGEAPPEVCALPEPLGIAVWRQGLEANYRTVEADEGEALHAIVAGETFAGVCERLLAGRVDGTEVASVWLGQWMGEGLVCDVV